MFQTKVVMHRTIGHHADQENKLSTYRTSGLIGGEFNLADFGCNRQYKIRQYQNIFW